MTRNDQVKRATLRLNLDLPCPLSELVNRTPHIPARDMCAWVHRPVETPPGGIATAWQDFTPNEFTHAAISILTGRSWKMQTPHIRKQYKTLAVTEKQMHAGAHPGYRFSPSTKKKRSRTARARSQKLVLRSEAFPKVNRSSQPHAGSTSSNNDRISGPSTGPFLADEETLTQSIPSNTGGVGSLPSAASAPNLVSLSSRGNRGYRTLLALFPNLDALGSKLSTVSLLS
ncbi:hypothetical protein AKAW_07125 [Aspergillus luchuensis IFO 4308]|nr:hypothetical protein AKAW_07125 [Aspergillus luchuensis IFO 4308]